MNTKWKVYVACSLTGASEKSRLEVEDLKSELRQMGIEVLDFVVSKKATDVEIYNNDIHHCVATCDMVLAVANLRSTGMGMEIGIAIGRYGRPVLAVAKWAKRGHRVTPMITGCNEPKFCFRWYDKMSEVPSMLQQRIAELWPPEETLFSFVPDEVGESAATG